MKRALRILALTLVLIALIGCGGGDSGKALAQDAVKAIQEQDEQLLTEIGERFEKLGAAQKVRFAAEIAQQGEEIQAAMQEIIKASLSE